MHPEAAPSGAPASPRTWKISDNKLALKSFSTEVDEFDVVRAGVKEALAADNFAQAYALVAQHRFRLRQDGEDNKLRRDLMNLFLTATDRLATQAHEAGEEDRAAGYVRFLFAYPPVHDSHTENRLSVNLYQGPEMTVEATKDNLSIFARLGRYLNDAGYHEEAIALLDQVVKYDEAHAEAQLHLGNALWPLDRRAQAVSAYRAWAKAKNLGDDELPAVIQRRLAGP